MENIFFFLNRTFEKEKKNEKSCNAQISPKASTSLCMPLAFPIKKFVV